MPTIDVEAHRKARRRQYIKGLKRGDMITCDLGMSKVVLGCGKSALPIVKSFAPPQRTAAEIEAERRRKAQREWEDQRPTGNHMRERVLDARSFVQRSADGSRGRLCAVAAAKANRTAAFRFGVRARSTPEIEPRKFSGPALVILRADADGPA